MSTALIAAAVGLVAALVGGLAGYAGARSQHATSNQRLLTADARNRAVRSLLIALAVAVFVDVWPVVQDALDGDGPVAWDELARAALRVGLQAAGSFLMRRVLDPSRVPTPLPPDPPGEPAD